MIQDGRFGTGGSITKVGTGALTLSGANTFTGGTNIQDGTLIVNDLNALGTGDVTLSDGTLRTLEGTPRTYVVGNNYTQHNGTVLFQVGGLTAGTHDLMQVGNAAFLPTDFAGSTGTLFVHRINNFSPTRGATVQIITATNFVDGRWANQPNSSVAPNDFPGLLQPFVIYNPANVTLDFELTSSFSSLALTRNQTSVANNIDNIINDPRAADLIAFLGSEPMANLPHDYDLIAPEELASIYEMGFSQAVVTNMNLMHRMDDIHSGSTGYSGPVVEIPTGKDEAPISDKNVVTKNVAPAFVPCPENRWGIFAVGSGDFVNVGNDDDNARGYALDNGSMLVGVDYRLGNHFAIGVDGEYVNNIAELVGKAVICRSRPS